MLLPAQTWDIYAGIAIMTIMIGFIWMGMTNDKWSTGNIFSLSLAISTWFWASTLLCRFLSPSLGRHSIRN